MSKSKLSRDEATEYSKNIGQVATGNYGLIDFAIHTLGVPQALGISPDEWIQELGGYVRWNIDQRRQAVKELTEAGRTSSEIGAVLGIGETTVKEDKAAIRVSEVVDAPSRAADDEDFPGQRPGEEVVDAVRRLLDRGKSQAETAALLGISTPKLRRLIGRDTSPSSKLQRAQAEKTANQPSEAERKAAEADAEENIRQPTMQALGGLRSPAPDVRQAIEDVRWFINEGVEITDYAEVVDLVKQLINELIVYGATHNLDVSSLEEARSKLHEEEQ
jgi:DNA-binding CsgD family transcriptional regulator